jgi:Ca2+/Na+ antiporter
LLRQTTEITETRWFRGKFSKQQVDTWYATSHLYWVSFVMCILAIWLMSWATVTFALHLGCVLNIGSYIMGLVVLAAGTSLPDTLSSIMVARDGFGDMVRLRIRV